MRKGEGNVAMLRVVKGDGGIAAGVRIEPSSRHTVIMRLNCGRNGELAVGVSNGDNAPYRWVLSLERSGRPGSDMTLLSEILAAK